MVNYLVSSSSSRSCKVLEYCLERMERINSLEEKEEEAETLKQKISSHPLYELLVQTHMDCLKVSCIGDHMDQSHTMKQNLPSKIPNSSSSRTQPDLDHFMEAYCAALSKLKEAMEEPQQETVAFINSMQLQLNELTITYHQTSESSTTLSGEND